MSVNKYQPHVLVLPEDDANRNLATGFLLDSALDPRTVQILPPAGGWGNVAEEFRQVHVSEMNRFPLRHMVLLVDFDEQEDRLSRIQQAIPPSLAARVCVLGTWSEPEKLRQSLNRSLENIGTTLAQDCVSESPGLWEHELLRHNASELARIDGILRSILFPRP
jgi:hypothetical protein